MKNHKSQLDSPNFLYRSGFLLLSGLYFWLYRFCLSCRKENIPIKTAEPGASPSGGPAESLGGSRVGDGPPSVILSVNPHMPTDYEALQGFWKLVDSTLGGQPHPHPEMGTIFRFAGNRFQHIRTRMSYRFEVHPDTTPKGIDFILVSTKGIARGIYELDGDTLRECSSDG